MGLGCVPLPRVLSEVSPKIRQIVRLTQFRTESESRLVIFVSSFFHKELGQVLFEKTRWEVPGEDWPAGTGGDSKAESKPMRSEVGVSRRRPVMNISSFFAPMEFGICSIPAKRQLGGIRDGSMAYPRTNVVLLDQFRMFRGNRAVLFPI